jgi:aryl-alcohol dehydrogenase-like predicted oxidoreductase
LRRATVLAEKRNVIPTTIALSFALQQKTDLFALFCPHNVRELMLSLGCLSLRLSESEMSWLDLESDTQP